MTVTEFFDAYAKGKRHFQNLDFEYLDGFSNQNFSGIIFQNCFLYLDFRQSNLSNAQFIGCNIKEIDLREANLTNAVMKNCLVESAMFKGAIIPGFTFIENYYWGAAIGQNEFERQLLNSDSAVLKKMLSEIDYKHLLGAKMIDVTEAAEPVIDIWEYVEALVYEKIVDKYVFENTLAEKVYRDNNGNYDHVLLPTADENTFIVIVVNIRKPDITGHYKLDLAKESLLP